MRLAGLPETDQAHQNDPRQWSDMQTRYKAVFKTKTRDEWAEIFDGTDACVSPVLSVSEATENAHVQARGIFLNKDGVTQAAPAPRFDRTPAAEIGVPSAPGSASHNILLMAGFSANEIDALRDAGDLT